MQMAVMNTSLSVISCRKNGLLGTNFIHDKSFHDLKMRYRRSPYVNRALAALGADRQEAEMMEHTRWAAALASLDVEHCGISHSNDATQHNCSLLKSDMRNLSSGKPQWIVMNHSRLRKPVGYKCGSPRELSPDRRSAGTRGSTGGVR